MTETRRSLQERYAPANICFGCGQANPRGLQIRSFAEGTDPYGEVLMDRLPEILQEAFDQVRIGGIIGTRMYCEANWTTILPRDGGEAE